LFCSNLLLDQIVMKCFSVFLKVLITVCSVQAVINITTAYAEHCFKRVDMLPLSSSCFKISSITILKRVADNWSPCFTPVIISTFLYSYGLL